MLKFRETQETSLMKALSVKAVDRYQSMEEFQEDLFVNMDVTVDPIVEGTLREGEGERNGSAICRDKKGRNFC